MRFKIQGSQDQTTDTDQMDRTVHMYVKLGVLHCKLRHILLSADIISDFDCRASHVSGTTDPRHVSYLRNKCHKDLKQQQ